VNRFEFHNPVRLIFGPGQVSRTGREAAKLGSRAMVVSYKEHEVLAGALGKVASRLASSGVEAATFHEVTPNPTIEQVRRGVAACKDAGADLVIGVGGGSAMDAAKLIAAGALYDGDPAGRDEADVAEEAIDRFESLLKSIGVETRLSAAGIGPEDVPAIVDDVVRISFGSDGMLAGRPPVSREDLTAILKLAEQ